MIRISDLLTLNAFTLVLPVAVLAAAFVYAQLRRGREVDMATGLTAYTALLLAASVLVLALGVGRLLTAVVAEFDADFAYSTDTSQLPPGALRTQAGQQDADLAAGLGLTLAGTASVLAHAALGGRLRRRGDFDDDAWALVDIATAIGAGLAAIALLGTFIGRTLDRAIVEESAATPGGSLAFLVAFFGVWAVYGARVLRQAGIDTWNFRVSESRDEDDDEEDD
jgi:hypothetical protein